VAFEVTDQQVANTVNLTRYQKSIQAEDEDGNTGTFIFHRATIGDEMAISVLAAQYLTPGGEGPSTLADVPDPVRAAAIATATLNTVCDGRPSWAPKDFRQLYSAELLGDLYNRYDEWVSSFRRRVSDPGGEDRGAALPTEPGLAGGVVEAAAL
jgi:hypothetical protein